jgi:hypothetical protein
MPISSLPLPGDEEPPDASSQIAWLRSLGDREALFQIMDGDRRSMQGLEAAEALAQLGDVRGLDHLIATLNDAHSGLRMEAAEIVERLHHPRGLRALRERQTETQSSPRGAEREEVYEDLSAATTDELMAIRHENDRAGWTDLEFEVIEGILLERLGSLPRREADSGGGPEVDDEVDPRIQRLWAQRSTDSLRRIMLQEPDVSLQLGAAEALADLGDEAALDFLIEMLDKADQEYSDTAAKILDWLDVPRGNAALREGGYEFEAAGTSSDQLLGEPALRESTELDAPHQQAIGRPRTESREQGSWTTGPPKMPARIGAAPGQDQGTVPGASFGAMVTGASGGLIGFLIIRFGLDLLGIRPLPNGLSGWLGPSMVYWLIESLVVGAVSGSIGHRVARTMATRDGDVVDEQDARLVLGALISGVAAAVIVGVLRFAFGG